MLLTYTPADGDEQVFEFKPDDMLNHEAEAIEKRTDWTWDEFLVNLQKGSTLARRALLWTFLRRVHHTLRFEDVKFSRKELRLDYDLGELAEMREAVEKAPETPGVSKEAMLAALDAEMAKALPDPGKARGNSDDASTSTRSRKSELTRSQRGD